MRPLPVVLSLLVLIGVIAVGFDLFDLTRDPQAATRNQAQSPRSDNVRPVANETDVFQPFRCESPFEICAQQAAADYCRKRQGSLNWWRAEPVTGDGARGEYKLVEIVCQQ